MTYAAGRPGASLVNLGGAVGAISMGQLARVASIVRATCDRLDLDLRGTVVATEAATGFFSALPSIAAMAGAKVYASPHQDDDELLGPRAVDTLSQHLRVASGIHIRAREDVPFDEVDIVTNSRALRPIDRSIISGMRPGTAIAVMYELWELRSDDIDVEAARDRGVSIVGVDENHPLVDTFRFVGPLTAKMLLAGHVELSGSKVAVVGTDQFATVTASYLRHAEVEVSRTRSLADLTETAVDALVLADLRPDASIRDEELWRSIAKANPGAVVIQLNGGAPAAYMESLDLTVIPSRPVAPETMGWSFGELGPRPTLHLLAAGVKAAHCALIGDSCGGLAQLTSF